MSSNIKIPKLCFECNNGFIAKTTVTKFCSDACAKRAYKKRKRTEKLIVAQEQEYIKSTGIDMQAIQCKDFLSVTETCLLLGISRTSLYRYIKKKKLKPSKIGGKVIFNRQTINKAII